jgi:hypothetical protein
VFKIEFNDPTVTGLVFEFPLLSETGVPIYNNPLTVNFFGLPDGAPYPCGNSNNGWTTTKPTVKCYIKNGDTTNLYTPTRIFMSDFTYSGTMTVRLLFHNPSPNNWLNIKIKAYGGSRTLNPIFGQDYLGYYNMMYILQTIGFTVANYNYTSTISSLYFYPLITNRLVWRNNNDFILSNVIPNNLMTVPAGSMTILRVPL